MPEYPFVSEYKDLARAFKNNLDKKVPGVLFDLSSMKLVIKEDELCGFANTAAEFILTDVKKHELDRITRHIPLSGGEKKALQLCSEKYTDDGAFYGYAEGAVLDSLKSDLPFCPEGILRFRMPLVMDEWALAVDRAAEELFFEKDRAELFKLLGALIASSSESEPGEVRLVLYPDGSAVFSGQNGLRIECAPALEAPVAGILCALSPARLVVYDIAGFRRERLLRSIRSLLGDRAVFYVLNE